MNSLISLTNRHILLGVTGGIAAYKSAELVRGLRAAGAQVRVVMTEAAQSFITPLTLQTLSGERVRTDLMDLDAEQSMGHIELARWADLVLIAPASADSIAKLAHGLADNLLTTLCLATQAPLVVAPAMNQAMWSNLATQNNVEQLTKRDVTVLGPAEGVQACGDVGPGRMVEPDLLIEALAGMFGGGVLSGVSVMVTAGPTREAIDPVRYISNRSSGKMGYAVAEAALKAGASVTLISGPTNLEPVAGVEQIDVLTAADMRAAVMTRISQQDIFISAAAVADYRPATVAQHKQKKKAQDLSIVLTPTQDIIADVAALSDAPFTVGFAAETENLKGYALRKLNAKSLDMIAANLVAAVVERAVVEDAVVGNPAVGGFDSDDNELEVFWEGGHVKLALSSKSQIANELIQLVSEHYSTIQPVNNS